MAQLSSPGVAVSVIDESFYTPAAAGTVPLIIVASQENKENSSGTGTAPGTLKANAGKAYLLTSQMDLGATFGVPYFQTDANNNPIHAGEVNEYGLQAAYSFLGVSNRAYVVRADVDTKQLEASAEAPTGEPANGTYWFDTADTHFGIFEWNSASSQSGGQVFTNKPVIVITETAKTANGAPLSSIGALGDYALVATTALNKLWMKKYLTSTAAGTWVEVGSPAWAASWPTVTGTVANPSNITASDTLSINGHAVTMTGVTTLTLLVAAINGTSSVTNLGITAANIGGIFEVYSTGATVSLTGTVVAKLGLDTATYYAPALQMSAHSSVPLFKDTDPHPRPTGSVWAKTTDSNLGAHWIVKKYNAATKSWISQSARLFPTAEAALAALDPVGGGINLPVGSLFVKFNDDEGDDQNANFKIYGRATSGVTAITSAPIGSHTFTSGNNTFTIRESVPGQSAPSSAITVEFTAAGDSSDAGTLLAELSSVLVDSNITATLNANHTITITHKTGGEIRLVDGTNTPLAALFTVGTTANYDVSPTGTGYIASNWSPTVSGLSIAPAADTAPTTTPADGTLWYNSIVDEVDIMIHNGSTWVGYKSSNLNGTIPALGGPATDPSGPIVSATQPTAQSDGTDLANGDLWISTADLENYPLVYKFNYLTKKWVLVDNSDQTTENGIVFHDARWNNDGLTGEPSTIASLLTSDFLDPDAPDPALYPRGTLLWNLRRSGFNVKKYVENYIDTGDTNLRHNGETMTHYYPARWTSVAANHIDGSGTFGRKAQRAVVLQALFATINENQEIRQPDSRVFNLISCPGYLETLSALVGLNTDNGQTAFIVADTPARLTPDATTLNAWGKNLNGAEQDGDTGLVTTDAYAGVYYPWGYTTDLIGNNIVVPPSHMMLRTIALSDNVSYPWFAPAGVRRGGITNASSTGYVDPITGEFNTVALNIGQRDTLADIHVNPITYIQGTGLVCYGQKTRQLVASSLDRINVARLVIYLRRQLDLLAKPFVFEPNDTITRNEIKQKVENLLLELVGQRALYDYLVVCDTSNNTPARIDRNELHVDIAIEPVKSVEFIYIPLRLENTGAIKGLGK